MTSTNLHHFLRSRRSVRRFTSQVVDGDALERILQTAVWAPSAHNRQPWRFAIITTPAVKARLAAAMAADFIRDLTIHDDLPPAEIEARVARSKARILSAPVIVVLCADMTDMDVYPDPVRQAHEHTMATQSVAAAGLQLMLAAHAEGLGSVWVCSPLFAPQAVQQCLQLPPTWQPQGMIFLGHAAQQPPARERKSIQEISLFL